MPSAANTKCHGSPVSGRGVVDGCGQSRETVLQGSAGTDANTCHIADAPQDFYSRLMEHIADSDELNGTAFSNAGRNPGGASTPLAGGDDAQLEGLSKLVSEARRLCAHWAVRTAAMCMCSACVGEHARTAFAVARSHSSMLPPCHCAQTFGRYGLAMAAPLAKPPLNVIVSCPGATESFFWCLGCAF